MADNWTTTDAGGFTVTLSSSDDGTSQAAIIVSKQVTVTATYTRPPDTNAYAANDAISNSTSAPSVLTFSGCARINAGGGAIVGAKLIMDEKNAIIADFHLWLFDTSPTAINDNAAFAPSTAETANVTAPILISGALMTDGSNSRIQLGSFTPVPFRCAAASKALYGLLQTRTPFTPKNGGTFKIVLDIIQET